MTKNEIKQLYKTDIREYWRLYAKWKRQNDPNYLKRYYARNREKLRAKFKDYYYANRDRMKGRKAQYFKLHPDKLAANARRNYAKRRGAIGNYTAADWEQLKKTYNYTCYACYKQEPEIKLTADHKIPLSKGGTNNLDNIQPMCMPCNSKKSTKTIFLSCPLTLG